jgi:hypothetical protein
VDAEVGATAVCGVMHMPQTAKGVIIIIIIIIIINPCKPYLSASATAPHPLGRRKAD